MLHFTHPQTAIHCLYIPIVTATVHLGPFIGYNIDRGVCHAVSFWILWIFHLIHIPNQLGVCATMAWWRILLNWVKLSLLLFSFVLWHGLVRRQVHSAISASPKTIYQLRYVCSVYYLFKFIWCTLTCSLLNLAFLHC